MSTWILLSTPPATTLIQMIIVYRRCPGLLTSLPAPTLPLPPLPTTVVREILSHPSGPVRPRSDPPGTSHPSLSESPRPHTPCKAALDPGPARSRTSRRASLSIFTLPLPLWPQCSSRRNELFARAGPSHELFPGNPRGSRPCSFRSPSRVRPSQAEQGSWTGTAMTQRSPCQPWPSCSRILLDWR